MKLLIYILAIAIMNTFSSDILEKYKWKNRVIILSVKEIAEPELNRQLNELKLNWKGVLDRDLVVLIQRDNLMQYTPDEMFSTDKSLDMSLLDDAADFQFLLIGKDGTVKMMSEEMVAHEKLFSTIDAMPMRKQEMRDN